MELYVRHEKVRTGGCEAAAREADVCDVNVAAGMGMTSGKPVGELLPAIFPDCVEYLDEDLVW